MAKKRTTKKASKKTAATEKQTRTQSDDTKMLKDLEAALAGYKEELAKLKKADAEEVAKAKQVREENARKQAAAATEAQALAENQNKWIQAQVNNPQWEKLGHFKLNEDSKRVIAAVGSYINNGKALQEAGYTQQNGQWVQTPSELPESAMPATDDINYGKQYPMTEITDLVLVDSISYAYSGGWDNFSEPQGQAQPGQFEGLKQSKEIIGASNFAIHSLINKGFTDNSMIGNLFGLSVEDIGNSMSVTDEDSASVLKYNYSGYGDPADLQRNIFEDSGDIHDHTRFLGNLNKTISIIGNT